MGQGLQFDNLTTKGTFPAVNGIIMLIVDSIIYLIIACYLDAVIPGDYGRRREPHFFLKPSFWKGLFGKNNKLLERQLSERIQNELSEDIEPVPVELHGKEAIRFVFNNLLILLLCTFALIYPIFICCFESSGKSSIFSTSILDVVKCIHVLNFVSCYLLVAVSLTTMQHTVTNFFYNSSIHNVRKVFHGKEDVVAVDGKIAINTIGPSYVNSCIKGLWHAILASF